MDNTKRHQLLCKNMIEYGKCTYENSCLYAHSYKQQNIDTLRHKVYNIMFNNNNLSTIDLITDNKLYATMLKLTKICDKCKRNQCCGGLNCREGAIGPKYQICYDDLCFGKCTNTYCNSIHLTKKGLVPYITQKHNKYKQNNIIKSSLLKDIGESYIINDKKIENLSSSDSSDSSLEIEYSSDDYSIFD